MANVLLDPRERPDAILGDFDTPHPLVTFGPDDITYTYGRKWKQRYFTQRGDDLFVFPAQWDVQNREWRRYGARPGTEWWTAHYPADQMQRPTGPLCDGCHSVNYDIRRKTVTEWNVGCEACHGAGRAHVLDPVADTVVNPARPGSTRCAPPTSASSAIRRGCRTTIRLKGCITTGRSAMRRASGSATCGSSTRRTSVKRPSRTGRKAPPTRTACRATTTSRARCT